MVRYLKIAVGDFTLWNGYFAALKIIAEVNQWISLKFENHPT